MTSRRHGMQVVTLCISTTMVLILLGLVVLSVLTARNLSTYVKENMSVNLVLGDTVSLADGQALLAQLKTRPYARQVKYISQEEALRIMTQEMGEIKGLKGSSDGIAAHADGAAGIDEKDGHFNLTIYIISQFDYLQITI